ncbi:MAG: hypothetical protein HY313_09780 [Acidobacteria bacterium]|nr:hypothetical protein [Acidobacteriota bacterium]
MTLQDRVLEVLRQEGDERNSDPEFRNLSQFYEDMRRLGIAIKKQYTLPQLDTIGHSLITATDTGDAKP